MFYNNLTIYMKTKEVPSMKYCSQCGKALADEAKFCSGCGKALAPVEPVKEPVEPVKDDTSFGNVPPIDDTPPVVAPADDTVIDPVPPAKKTLLQKIKAFTWKAWLIVAAAVIALGVGIWFLVDALTNNYETPVKNYVEWMNATKHSWDMYSDLCNGFAESEVDALISVLKKTKYADKIENNFMSYIGNVFGIKNKYSYKIEDKDKLDEDDLEDFQEQLNESGKNLLDQLENIDGSWDVIANSFDISTSQSKKLFSAWEDFGKLLKKAKVTEGYELTVTITRGSELGEPIEQEMTTMNVYKVDGRWITMNTLSKLALRYILPNL